MLCPEGLRCGPILTNFFNFKYAQKNYAGFPAFLPSDFLFHLASNLFNQILKNNNNFNEKSAIIVAQIV